MVNVRLPERFVAEENDVRVAFPEVFVEKTISSSRLSRLTNIGRKNAEISPAQKGGPEIMEWKK